jgi:DNA excision repair protein ERCC-4
LWLASSWRAVLCCAVQVAAATAQREEAVVNQPAIDLLRQLPGVTDANYRALMNGSSSLAELATLDIERLEQLMGGAKAAQALHNFLHAPCPLTTVGPAGIATA